LAFWSNSPLAAFEFSTDHFLVSVYPTSLLMLDVLLASSALMLRFNLP